MKRKRNKRAKNGTTTWKVTTMNINTERTTVRTFRATYDEITAKIHHIRSGNPYNAVCAEEMHPWGGKLLKNGRVVALDSLEDERMFERVMDGLEDDIDDPFGIQIEDEW